ncbi:MAG: hypothetical protein A3J83_04650 [Elusimicrobia bacterium RIFOXYA2_FULL_40_6]|nr:MAG: hypothetical protein A3J83_04650 [Elusimicrobia bacterium RIFOXYA2_FULL_40_6]
MKKLILSVVLIAAITCQIFALACPKCNEANPEGSKFCASCGEKIVITPPAPAFIFCAECGEKNLGAAKFCAKCGNKLTLPAAVSAPKTASKPVVTPVLAPAPVVAAPVPVAAPPVAPAAKPRSDFMFGKKSSKAPKQAAVPSAYSDEKSLFCAGVNYTGASLRIKGFEIKYQISGDTKLYALRLYSGEMLYKGFELGSSDSNFAAGVEGGVFGGIQKKFGNIAVYFDAGIYYISVWQKNYVNNQFSDYGIVFNSGVNIYLF